MGIKTAKVRDLTISYGEDGEGPPVILLHGGLATAEMNWGKVLPLLTQNFRVFSPDSRGHGRTNNPAGEMSYSQFADDVVAFAGALGIEKPLVVGYSDGGQTGLEMARQYPGFASAYVLGGTLAECTKDYVDGLVEWGFLAPGEVDLDKIAAGWGPYFETIKTVHKGNGEPDYWRSAILQVSAMWHGLPTYSMEQLGRMAEPMLVIAGDRDHMVPVEQALMLHRGLPNGELAIIANADHSVSNKDLFWTAVEDFLLRKSGMREESQGW